MKTVKDVLFMAFGVSTFILTPFALGALGSSVFGEAGGAIGALVGVSLSVSTFVVRMVNEEEAKEKELQAEYEEWKARRRFYG